MNVKDMKISTVVLGIILVIVGIFMLRYPTNSFDVMSKALGIGSIIKGLMLVGMFFKRGAKLSLKGSVSLVLGILLTIFGLMFLINPGIFAKVITYIISFWFVIIAIIGLSFSRFYKDRKVLFILNIVASICLVIGAVLILFRPISVAISMSIIIGLVLVIDGIQSIVWALTIKVID